MRSGSVRFGLGFFHHPTRGRARLGWLLAGWLLFSSGALGAERAFVGGTGLHLYKPRGGKQSDVGVHYGSAVIGTGDEERLGGYFQSAWTHWGSSGGNLFSTGSGTSSDLYTVSLGASYFLKKELDYEHERGRLRGEGTALYLTATAGWYRFSTTGKGESEIGFAYGLAYQSGFLTLELRFHDVEVGDLRLDGTQLGLSVDFF